MEDSRKVKVVNRVFGEVGYSVPDMNNLRRNFQGKEEKILTFEELRKLSYIPGGNRLLRDYLIVEDKEVLDALDIHPEPEYFYKEEDVKRLLTEGSMDEFLDCLDFAPSSVIGLIKQLAVEMKLNDLQKRQAILEKTDFNVTSAIALREDAKDLDVRKNVNTVRRVGNNTEAVDVTPTRRVAKS